MKHHLEFNFLDDDRKTMLTLIVKDYRDLACRIVERLADETGSKLVELVFQDKQENKN